MFVVSFCFVVFGIDEQTNATGGVEYFDEFLRRGHEEQSAQPLSLPRLRDCKPAQLHAGHLTGQTTRHFWRQLLCSKLTDVQSEVPGGRFGIRRGYFNEDKGPRYPALRVLAGSLPEVGIERFAATIEAIAVMRSGKKFELKHVPDRGRP